MSRICLARVDRIGDLILTLPCQSAWRFARPNDEIHWLVSDSLRFVMNQVEPSPTASFVAPVTGFFSRLQASFQLVPVLRAQNFDQVVAFHVPWWVALSFFLARIPRRTGVASQWFSWFFFNHRLRQKRSQATQNEARYNLDLVNFALDRGLNNLPLHPAKLVADKKVMMKWAQEFKRQEIDLSRLLVIHPGMGGSARNWPPEKYLCLAREALAKKYAVVVTGSPVDRLFIEKTGLRNLLGVTLLVENTSGADLLAILSLAQAVVVPSTGVAHLAASLGVHTIGIYSPVRVQAPVRWAPLGNKVQIAVPLVECPGTFNCLGTACPHFDCMEQISVDSVLGCVMDKEYGAKS